jgi:hypothetical protein
MQTRRVADSRDSARPFLRKEVVEGGAWPRESEHALEGGGFSLCKARRITGEETLLFGHFYGRALASLLPLPLSHSNAVYPSHSHALSLSLPLSLSPSLLTSLRRETLRPTSPHPTLPHHTSPHLAVPRTFLDLRFDLYIAEKVSGCTSCDSYLSEESFQKFDCSTNSPRMVCSCQASEGGLGCCASVCDLLRSFSLSLALVGYDGLLSTASLIVSKNLTLSRLLVFLYFEYLLACSQHGVAPALTL